MTRRRVLAALSAAAIALAGGCLPKRPARPARADLAAISDLHLGDPRSILNDDAGRAVLLDALAEACARRGVHTLVLDGDVLELALASERSAFDSARALFRELNRVRGLERVVVLIGNHDHRLFEDLPDPLPTKIGREYDDGTRFHREVAGSADRLRLTVVYPGWSVAVRGGTVHFTHGHYFDRVVTPSFDGAMSVAELEERNLEWWRFLNAGGRDRSVRSLYRAAYHFGHHLAGLVDAAGGAAEGPPPDLSRREEDRLSAYLAFAGEPDVLAVVSGHTHANGGRIATVLRDGRSIGVFDPGAFVVGHHGRPARPHLFLLDTKTARMVLLPLVLPGPVVEAAEKRAFETVP